VDLTTAWIALKSVRRAYREEVGVRK